MAAVLEPLKPRSHPASVGLSISHLHECPPVFQTAIETCAFRPWADLDDCKRATLEFGREPATGAGLEPRRNSAPVP